MCWTYWPQAMPALACLAEFLVAQGWREDSSGWGPQWGHPNSTSPSQSVPWLWTNTEKREGSNFSENFIVLSFNRSIPNLSQLTLCMYVCIRMCVCAYAGIWFTDRHVRLNNTWWQSQLRWLLTGQSFDLWFTTYVQDINIYIYIYINIHVYNLCTGSRLQHTYSLPVKQEVVQVHVVVNNTWIKKKKEDATYYTRVTHCIQTVCVYTVHLYSGWQLQPTWRLKEKTERLNGWCWCMEGSHAWAGGMHFWNPPRLKTNSSAWTKLWPNILRERGWGY